MNYIDYAPVGVDHKIRLIQDVLATYLGWSDIDYYGRVVRFRDDAKKVIVPHLQITAEERRPVAFDDVAAKGGNIFFIDEENHEPGRFGVISAKVRVVCMLDLSKLFPQATNRPDVLAQDKVARLLKRTRMIHDLGLIKGSRNVLAGFSQSGFEKCDVAPYHTFAITGKINYTV